MGNKSSKRADPHSSIVPAKRIERLDFPALVTAIQQLHEHLSAQAGRAVNISLTMRNWTIGLYIAEYELRGADRATYGANLLAALAERLKRLRISNCSRRQLYKYLRFYRLYPRIVRTLPPQLKALLPTKARDLEKVGTMSPQFQIPPERFIQGLSYSHAGDNPPVGILLCTHKDRALVEYALAGMDNNLFVSKYKLELPSTEEMRRFIEKQAKETRQEKPFAPCARRRRRGA